MADDPPVVEIRDVTFTYPPRNGAMSVLERARAIGCDAVRWVGVDELEKYPFPAANRKVIAALKDRAACGR